MRRLVLLIVLIASSALGLSACTSLSLKGEQVRTTDHESDVAGCKALGEVVATPPFVGPKDAEHTIRNEAAKLGGDVVIISNGIGKATGRVYDCGGKYAAGAGR